jgi:hypothetical protein
MTNRKPFDLQKALAGDPVETREGREIKVVFVSEMNEEYPVLCVYKDIDFEYVSRWYKKSGQEYSNRESNLDLFMLTKKKALWIAVSKEPYASNAHYSSAAFKSKDELIGHIKRFGNVPENFHLMQIEIDE